MGLILHFGTKALGNVQFLKDNQKKYGYNLIVIEKEQYHNKDISSTAIREKIVEGKMQEVNDMLNHPYTIIGKVEEGKTGKANRTSNSKHNSRKNKTFTTKRSVQNSCKCRRKTLCINNKHRSKSNSGKWKPNKSRNTHSRLQKNTFTMKSSR